MHQPTKRRFDPGHSVERERGDELARAKCRVRDLISVGLVNDDAFRIKVGSDFAQR
jgi:hypothetical protein